jgi:hypothetical protein
MYARMHDLGRHKVHGYKYLWIVDAAKNGCCWAEHIIITPLPIWAPRNVYIGNVQFCLQESDVDIYANE